MNLDKLEALAKDATRVWKRSRPFGQLNVQDDDHMLSDDDALYAEAANPTTILELIALIRKQESALQAPAPSVATVDTPELVNLMTFWAEAERGQEALEKYQAVIAHIDAHVAAKVDAAVARIDLNGIEQYRIQMAGISTAALGYWTEADTVAPEYDTPALRDVAKLYAKYAALSAQAAAPVVASDAIPQELRDIGEMLRTQDNRITDQPMFIVQQRRRITGLDTDFCENIVWLHCEDAYSEADNDKNSSLEAEYQETGRQPSGWLRTGYSDEWEFVTACFTEQGCKDYLARDGHNLKEPRIYADGSYRNAEFRAVRNWLMSLAANASQPSPAPVAMTDEHIIPDWPFCNPGCDYEDPNGGHHDGRDKFCACEAAKVSIAKQRAILAASQQPAAAPGLSSGGVKPAGFDVCPISGCKFWGNINHPERGMLATYGGPFDTFSIPYLDEDDELRVERFDQDRGEWIEGGEPYGWFYDEQQPEPAAEPVQAAVVPEGYVLVPVEPTPQMLEVGGRAILDTNIESKILWLQGNARSTYSAMLAASHQPAPVQPVAVPEEFPLDKLPRYSAIAVQNNGYEWNAEMQLEEKNPPAGDYVKYEDVVEMLAATSQAPVPPADAAPASQVRDERADFEHHERESELERDSDGDYLNPCVQSAWEGWQAGRAAGIEEAQSTYAPTEDAAWAIYNVQGGWGHEPTAKGLFIDGYRAAAPTSAIVVLRDLVDELIAGDSEGLIEHSDAMRRAIRALNKTGAV